MADQTYGETLLRETREELARADTKASIVLAASGIVFAALLTRGTSASWYPTQLTSHLARHCAWGAVGLALVGLCLVAAAVKPRLRAKHSKPDDLHYFADVEAFWPQWWQLKGRNALRESGKRAYVEALKAVSTPKKQHERREDQIWALSHIAYRKYRLVSIGMMFYAAALLVAFLAFVLEMRWL